MEHAFLLVVFLLVAFHRNGVGASRELPPHYARFFRALGHRIRSYRTDKGLSQEDMMSLGFSVRHWQMIEAGRPSTLFTVLRVCEAFGVLPEQLLAGLGQHLKKPKRS
jgi:Helix-turn-helix domain